jgi:hypothetical protein
MRALVFAAAALVLPLTAAAQTAPATPPETPAATTPTTPTASAPAPSEATSTEPAYAVPVETLGLEKAKGKFGEDVFATGGYVFATSTSVKDRSGPFSIDVLGASRKVKLVQVKYRFTKLDGAPIAEGQCTMNSKMWSGLWNTADNSLYTCALKETVSQGFALEAVIPNIEAQSNSMISFTKDNPDKYKILKARMRYNDELYEAIPTGFDPERESSNRRVADGYTITREGKLVGRIDFPNYKGRVIDVGGSYERNNTKITAPTSENDGREAVIFFAGQLLRLPEANSPALLAE